MRILQKTIALISAVVLAAPCGAAVHADDNIRVRMKGVTSNGTEYVTFGDAEPFQIDNRTLTPARYMAEGAGMAVEWDQQNQTALLTLNVDADSDKPIERYASKLINKIGGYGLDLTPTSITAALKLEESTAVIRYNFVDSEGDNVPIGKTYDMVSKAVLVDDARLMIPLRDSMEMFGLKVDWYQDELCAEVYLPDTIELPEDLKIIANHGGTAGNTQTPPETTEPENPVDNGGHGAYIGNFKITHYCPCDICNGGWGAYTAWAGELVPGQSIAVNPNIIPPLSWVYIDGYGLRRAEDTGGGIGEYHIDMAVPTHAMAVALGVVYRDVYFAE